MPPTRSVAPIFAVTLVTLVMAVAGFVLGLVPMGASAASQQDPAARVPSGGDINARAQRLVANQHKDDDALTQYERIERHTDFTAGPNPRTIDDRVYRIVPTGTGNLKILLKENGTPTDAAEYRRQLQSWEELLHVMLNPDDSRTKIAYDKYNRRNHQRAELVDAIVESFAAKGVGHEVRNGRTCDIFELTPKADFHPHSILQEALSHITAKIWVSSSDQMVRGEAHVTRDISFGGGILGKVYRGGIFAMEQEEVTPGVWEPTRYQYDFGGRKFLFGFDEHQVVEASHYRRVGPPEDALIVVQNELASGKPIFADP
jgi:hypothetical protein